MARYESLGAEADLSVVVPKSARKLLVDEDGYTVFSMVILRKFLSQLQHVCRESRYTLRVFSVCDLETADAAEDDEETQLAQYEAEEKKIKADLLQWCRPNYSELVVDWVHLKALRVYVESILRYGLHVDTYSFVIFVREADWVDV